MQALVYNPTLFRWLLCKALGLALPRVFYGPLASLRLMDCPSPGLPGPDWVRLKTILGGICGTDLTLVTQHIHPASILRNYSRFPAVLGHENVAVIDELGPAVSGWHIGQRVCVEPAVGCQGRPAAAACPQCAAGRPTLCERFESGDALPPRALIGLNPVTGGSWASSFVAHQSQLHGVPAGVPDDVAVLVDPIASATHAVLRRRPEPGESVLVHGSGVIAMGVVAALRALGCDNDVTITVRHAFQADLAAQLGATHVLRFSRGGRSASRYEAVAERTGGRMLRGIFDNHDLLGGFDLTYDCTGSGSGLSDALKWTRSRGCVVLVGTTGITWLHTTPIWLNELTVLGANGRQIESVDGHDCHTYDVVLGWLASGRLDLSRIPVRRFRLADYRAAFREILRPGRGAILKAAFEP